MKKFVVLISTGICFFVLANAFISTKKAESGLKPFALIELFTSESCSSCPPADKLMNDITDDSNLEGKTIFVVPLHVDYWNHLQWEDPNSSKKFTDRQYAYDEVLKDGIYTPQAVINGMYPFVGSDKAKLHENIKKAMRSMPLSGISLLCPKPQTNENIKISYKISNLPANAVLNFAVLKHNIISHVLHGENEGKELRHASATISFTTIDPYNEGVALLPAVNFNNKGKYSIIAFLQDKTTMKALAAEEIELSDF